MLKSTLQILALPLLFALAPLPAMAVVLNTPSIADTTIGDGGAATSNRGAQLVQYVGDPGARFKSLFQFSLAGIPANQTIDSATLQLAIADNGGLFTSQTVDLRRMLVSWIEGDGTSNASPGTTGATWITRDQAGSLANWSAAGASSALDRSATITATVGSANVSGGILSIDVTGDVQQWYSGFASNFGWLLEDTAPAGNYIGFATKEHATLQEPTLVVNYSEIPLPAPEPSSLVLFAMGGCALAIRRRHLRTVGRR